MTIEAQLAQLQQAATEQTEASVQLANNITEGLQEIDQVKQDIAKAYDTVSQNNQALNDWQTQSGSVNLKDLNGNSHTLPTLKSLVADAQSVNPNPHVMTKAQFDALRDMRKQQYAGSGFVEWGKHYDSGVNAETVNEGMDLLYGQQYLNFLKLGSKHKSSTGSSKTYLPIVVIDGTTFELSDGVGLRGDGTAVTNGDEWKRALFPPAPDGTKTYDSATGTVTQHSNAEAAFAAETENNKVITSRKDLVFLEAWHEKIADKDVVYPLGNVQYGASSYKDIGLRNNLVAQGYSAFGEWDSATKGYGIKWSSLTEAQKATFLGEPEHNIYYDPEAKAYIQVRYRIRVIEGVGDNWYRTQADGITVINRFLGYSSGNQTSAVKPQGASTELLDLGAHSAGNKGMYKTPFTVLSNSEAGLGAFVACQYDGLPVSGISSNNKCYALPIALVQRLNQGAYHPSYNPLGCKMWNDVSTGTGGVDWHKASAGQMTNTTECFKQVSSGQAVGAREPTGKLGQNWSGRPDQYRYHDAIYAGQVEDLRLSAKKQDFTALREETMRKAVAGELRGKSSLPVLCVSGSFTVQAAAAESQNDGRIRIQTSLTGNQTFTFAYRFGGNSDVYLLSEEGDLVSIPLGMSKYSHIHVQFPSNGNLYLGCSSFSEIVPAINNRLSGKKCRLIWAGQLSKPIGMINGGAKKPVHEEHTKFLSASHMLYSHSTSEFDLLPWVDIIGHPENIATIFPDGVVGQWVPKLPTDDTEQIFDANRKCRSHSAVNAVRTMDNGQTWQAITAAINDKNQIQGTWNAQSVGLVQYESLSHFTEPANNSQIFGTVGNVYQGNFHHVDRGNRLNSSISGVIAKQGSRHKGVGFLNTNNFTYESWSIVPWKLSASAQPEHQQIDLAPDSDSGGVKTLSTVTEKNGLLYLQFHGSELKYKSIHLRDVEVIEAGVEASVVKGKVYRLQGFDNAHLNRPVIALQDRLNFTFSASAFDGYRVAHDGRIMTSSGAEYSLIRVHNNDWGDDQTIPIINGENTKTDLNGNTVKVFCHHTLFPIGIAHNG